MNRFTAILKLIQKIKSKSSTKTKRKIILLTEFEAITNPTKTAAKIVTVRQPLNDGRCITPALAIFLAGKV